MFKWVYNTQGGFDMKIGAKKVRFMNEPKMAVSTLKILGKISDRFVF